MTVTYLHYELARARQEEYRQQAGQWRRALAATRVRRAWPQLRRRFTARPARPVSARA